MFEFPDKTSLRVDIAHATAHLGGGDHSIGVSQWVLSKGSAVLNRGGLKDLLFKGPLEGGCFAVFKFPDGTTLRVDIAHATESGGGGDPSISVSKWVLSKGSDVLIEGSFHDLIYKGQPR